MITDSIWQTFEDSTSFPTLIRSIDVDVAIIGGGITGITTAQLLAERGYTVAVLESVKVGISNTGHSTGNLYEVMGKGLIQIRKKYSSEVVKKIVSSRRGAMDLIEENIKRFKVDCDFKKVPWTYYTATKEMESMIDREHALAQEIQVPLNYIDLAHPSLTSIKAVRLENQAQFNPLRYMQGLAKAIANEKCQVYESSKVMDVEKEDEHHLLKTQEGTVRAKFIVHATHTPKGVMTYHMLLEPYREYGIACKVRDPQHPEGIFFGHYDSSSHYSTRFYERNGERYLIVVGSPHKVGHEDSHQHIQKLERFAREHFDVLEVTHRWGGQHYKPADELPYIGQKGSHSQIFLATGFSTHGLVYGTLAAQIISDQIQGKSNNYEELYSPKRFTPVKSVKNFVKENASVFYDFVKDYLTNHPSALQVVPMGEGQVMEHGGHKLAVYHDETEGLKVCSAVCPHLGCVVRWNNDERSWDCPCHGSRFDTDGEVLEGPSLYALARAEVPEDKTLLRNPKPTMMDNLSTGLDF